MQPRTKKSETFEVRISHETKQAFMARCRAEGRPASEVVRGLIDGYLARPASTPLKEPTPMKPPIVYPAAFAAAALAAGVLAATASTAQPDLRKLFGEIDRDADGAITLAEFRSFSGDMLAPAPALGATGPKPIAIPLTQTPALAALMTHQQHHHAAGGPAEGLHRAAFGAADGDRDGKVDFKEFQAHHQGMASGAFARLDANADGRLAEAEFLSGPHAAQEPFRESLRLTFARMDANRDGAVTRSEFDLH